MRSRILAIPEADRTLAQQLATATWPATAQGMFEQPYLRNGARYYVNAIADVSEAVDVQLRAMQENYIPDAIIIEFDADDRAGAALFAIAEAGFTREETL